MKASGTWRGITLAEGLGDWGKLEVPLLNYTLVFASQLRKITGNLSQSSRIVFYSNCYVDLAALLRPASTGLLNISSPSVKT